jgi:ice-binding like protein/Big-like domain-containing protein
MKKFKINYLLAVSILCFFIITGCSSSGGSTVGGIGTSPQVTYTINANGATNVPVNTKAGAFFTTEMDPGTINTSTFILKQGATPVAGEVTYNGLGAVFTPLNNLTPYTTYTATITSQARDLAGNSLAKDYVWSWTTGAVLDTTLPKVIHTVNADGATNVFINTKIIATFSKVMDPSTITAANFTFMQGSTPVPGKVTYLGLSLIFTPTNLLAANTRYTATITTGVKDLAGNALPSSFVWSWTTGSRLNTATPQILFTTPNITPVTAKTVSLVTPNISLGVLTASATFSEPMDPLTITTLTFSLNQGTTPVPGTVIYNPLSLTASFIPTNNLAPNTTYTATVTTGVRNIAGTPLASSTVWSFTTSPVVGQVPVNLGTAANFAILAGSTITNTGNTTITGDVGLSPGTAVTGFPPGVLNGTFHLADPIAATAKLDLTAAFNDAAGRTGVLTVPTELGGTTLPPGVYNSAAGTFGITGTLTLDAQGNPDAVFIFQAASTLITASNSSVVLINGAQAKNVFWQVGSSATLGTFSIFKGNILAQASITVTTGATIEGRALTQTAAVTLDTNSISIVTLISPAIPAPPPVLLPAVNLGTAANFAILAGSTITNTGASIINGDIGLSPGTAVTGFPPGVLNGVFHLADPTAATAKLDLTAAFNDAAGRTGAITIPTELGGTTLPPGVYNSAAGTFGITGTLTLDGQNNPNAVFIFQAASTLITASSSKVVLINGAQANNIFWQVGSSATLGTFSIFKGNILAQASITVTTGTVIDGRALAQTAAVTLDTDTFNATVPVASVPPATPGTVTGTNAADVTPVSTAGGIITVVNNGGHVSATITGPGAINITNNGAAVTVTENGAGTFNILNNGQVLTATNTGNGVITINSTCTGAVTVTNTGNGNITVNATGTTPITLIYTDGFDHTYP